MPHFISYSPADGEDFALRLADALDAGPPSIPTWLDKRNLRPGEDWDPQIDSAIRTCDSLIFVMSVDSVEDRSECKREWSRALKYKKAVIPLRLHPDAELPFSLESRQYIDFSSGFAAGLARLRQHLQWLPTFEGQLQSLHYRLQDAQRDLRRASESDQDRVRNEIAALKRQINRLEQILCDPEKAVTEVEQSISTRMEAERRPPPRSMVERRAKFVNPPPMVASKHFQNRFVETELVADFLKSQPL